MLRTLLGARLSAVKGGLRSDHSGRHRAPLFLGLSALFALLLYRGAAWLVVQTHDLEPVGELLLQKIIAIAFLIFLGLLSFSNLVSIFTTFYLAEDLEFLVAQPVEVDALFASRYLESMLLSSWVIVCFGMPPLVAFGVGVGAGWAYYVALPLVFLPFVAIPTGIAALVALGITNALVATRMRDSFLFLGLLALVSLFGLVRWLAPERLLNPESFETIGELVQMLSTPRLSFLPSDWALNVLKPLLFGGEAVNLWALALLYTTPLALFFLAAWGHRRLYLRGYCRVQEGRHGKSALTAVRDWYLRRGQAHALGPRERLLALAHGAPEGASVSLLGQLMRKDRRIFVRDASQWSNILVILSLITIYLVNYKYFKIATKTNFFGEAGLYTFNLAACGFVIVAMAGRFLFPAISIEGKSFWMMIQAPLSLERLLVGKWLGAMAPVVVVGQLMVWASNLLVAESLVFMMLASAFAAALSVSVSAISVGMGAIYPQFHNPNASSISASFGALIFMITSIFLILACILMTIPFMADLDRLIAHDLHTFDPRSISLYVCAYLLPGLLGLLCLKLGASSLRRRF